jgi:hypothetical protein
LFLRRRWVDVLRSRTLGRITDLTSGDDGSSDRGALVVRAVTPAMISARRLDLPRGELPALPRARCERRDERA